MSSPHIKKWFWVDRVDRHSETRNPQRRRNLILGEIDKAGFQKWVVFVAGVGFFTDSYLLFASNFVLPMLAFVYWDSDPTSSRETAINSATLAGSIIGQIVFGVLADRFGRRKMYGIELMIMVIAVLGLAMSSTGIDGSMRIMSWLVFWRFVAGVGIGAEHPLSAVITAEFAPTKHRARMIATVFLMQSMGQLAACLVSMILIAIVRQRQFTNEKVAIDIAWRWVIGIGGVPALVSLIFRLTIPESPRYTLDVLEDVYQAGLDSAYFLGGDAGNNEGVQTEADTEGQPEGRFHPAQHNGHVGGSEVDPGSGTLHANGRQRWMVEFLEYLRRNGNWRSLIATAGTWLALDFAFYGLGMGNPRTIAKIWNVSPEKLNSGNETSVIPGWSTKDNPNDTVYDTFLDNGTRALIVVSIGAILGGLGFIYAVNHVSRKKLQAWGFWALAVLFIIVGATYSKTVSTNFHGVTIMLYVLCQVVFNFGPNSTTFLFPAEIFPTQFRCTCHGISAAAGKIGSVLAQVFLGKVTFNGVGSSDPSPRSNWLGYVLLVFAAFMVLGAGMTYDLPEVQDERHQCLTLEDLAKGRDRRMSGIERTN